MSVWIHIRVRMIDKRHLLWGPNMWVSIRSQYRLVTLYLSPITINHCLIHQPASPGWEQSQVLSEILQVGSKPKVSTSPRFTELNPGLEWVYIPVQGMGPSCYTAQKPQQWLLIGRGTKVPAAKFPLVYITLWCMSTMTKVNCIFSEHDFVHWL